MNKKIIVISYYGLLRTKLVIVNYISIDQLILDYQSGITITGKSSPLTIWNASTKWLYTRCFIKTQIAVCYPSFFSNYWYSLIFYTADHKTQNNRDFLYLKFHQLYSVDQGDPSPRHYLYEKSWNTWSLTPWYFSISFEAGPASES